MIQYGAITINGSQVSTTINGYPDTNSIVVYNETPYFLNISFVGSGNLSLAAYTADSYLVSPGFTGGIQINPTQYLTTDNQSPTSVIFIQTYGRGEYLTNALLNHQSSGYPISLGRLQNIGNQLNVVASSIQNDTSISNTNIIEATVLGDNSSGVTLTNNGVMVLGNISGNRPGKIFLQDLGGASSNALIELTGGIVVNNGSLQLNTTPITVNGGSSGQASIYQIQQGTYKKVMIYLSSFRTTSQIDVTLPVAFTSHAIITTGGTGTSTANAGLGCLASGVLQNISIITTIASGGGSSTSGTFIYSFSIGEVQSGFDSIRFQASGTTNHTGLIFIEGL